MERTQQVHLLEAQYVDLPHHPADCPFRVRACAPLPKLRLLTIYLSGLNLALAREEQGAHMRSADEVESALIEQLRLLGNETLTHWAYSAELPIGSGLIESAHKHVIQYRLELPGAAWSIKNAEAMIQARAFRANGFWDSYWRKQRNMKTAA